MHRFLLKEKLNHQRILSRYSRRKGDSLWMITHKLLINLLIIPLLFTSCSSVSLFKSQADQLICSETWKKSSWTLQPGEISLEADLNQDEIMKNAGQSLNLLIDRQNSLAEEGALQTEMVLRLKEYSFMKDYRLLNTLCVELLVMDPGGNCLARYFHAEESKDSFYSSRFMYKQLEKGFKKLFR